MHQRQVDAAIQPARRIKARNRARLYQRNPQSARLIKTTAVGGGPQGGRVHEDFTLGQLALCIHDVAKNFARGAVAHVKMRMLRMHDRAVGHAKPLCDAR